MQPKVDCVEAPWIVPERVDLGRELHRLPTGPANKALLREQRFETSLEEANLVGNIYREDSNGTAPSGTEILRYVESP